MIVDQNDRPNSIPTRILKLSNTNISDQLLFLTNQTFFSGLFSPILEISKLYQYTKKLKIRLFKLQTIFVYSQTLTKFWKGSYITDFKVILKKKGIHIVSLLMLLFVLQITSKIRLRKVIMLVEFLQTFKSDFIMYIALCY